ncbi:multimeric flavodoxin WrbA [Pontibacter aydingkolensis]|uniref:NAD(P)H-dependent oxidoreductase n=1 Tax=Pontibacter aydingkolensis TaxID=1911536 RepID=A0ABS7CZF1_9BACT|nr:NAD(P)H-dependent oxidoreductase [Pontibacter aydingkolensis]MBW7469229.1 NAD(P)H-dependent oxidoreductase [Pontibacter aydingkolensis]
MATNPLVILGSARKDSDTRKLVDRLFKDKIFILADLLDYEINNYSYTHDYPGSDDFLKVVEQMIQHEQIVFATPVYWYAMSGIMKTFFDRLTDIITIHKNLGKQLAGKETFLLAVGSDDTLPVGFSEPFELTSAYFDMQFRATYYASTNAVKGKLPDIDTYLRLLHFD